MDESGWKWMKVEEMAGNGWKWIIWMKVDDMDEVDESGWNWMKSDENGWTWMKVDEQGWTWMNMDELDESGWKWMTDADAVTPSTNTRSYTLRSVPSSPWPSFLDPKCCVNGVNNIFIIL